MGVFLLISCTSDTGQVSELEEQLLTANGDIASLESDLFTATSMSIPTTSTVATANIEGTFALGSFDHRSNEDSTGCWGDRGYTDISEGTNVVVRDGEGAVIGTSSLDAGVRVEDIRDFGNYSFWRCEFSFDVLVPADSPFYALDVSHRGELTYSNADMVTLGWIVEVNSG